MKPTAARAHNVTALARLIWPAGRWRPAVRGLAASNFRSTMRLKDMAQVRAQTIAARINQKMRQPGQPWVSRAATAMEASAKGSAKTVCDSLTKPAHLLIIANIFNYRPGWTTGEHRWKRASSPRPSPPLRRGEGEEQARGR